MLLAALAFFIYYSFGFLSDKNNMDIYLNLLEDIKSNGLNYLFIKAPEYATLFKDKLHKSGSERYDFIHNYIQYTYQKYENGFFETLNEDIYDAVDYIGENLFPPI